MNMQDRWARVVWVEGSGYVCDETQTGRGWSGRQRHAAKYSKAEAHGSAAEFRDIGEHATVVRLRPRAPQLVHRGN